MLKKVTAYLPEKDVRALKRISSKKKISMAQLMRTSVQMLCEQSLPLKTASVADIMRTLSDVHKKTKRKNISDQQIMKWAVQAQREIRREKAHARTDRR